MIPRGILSRASEAAALTAFEHGMGALHIGAAVLDSVPPGWCKGQDGKWSQLSDGGMRVDNYRKAVIDLFSTYVKTVEQLTYGSNAPSVELINALDTAVQQRAFVLGIDVEKGEDGRWTFRA